MSVAGASLSTSDHTAMHSVIANSLHGRPADVKIVISVRTEHRPGRARGHPLTRRIGATKLLTMRILVDLNRCQGYGQCVFLAPSVFELHGEEALMYDPGPEEKQLVPVVRAAAACPVQAIRVDSSAQA